MFFITPHINTIRLMKKKILFIDDDRTFLRSITSLFRPHFDVEHISYPQKAIQIFENEDPDYALIISDMKMPGMSGVELLSRLAELAPHIPRIMLTGYGDYDTAVEALNKGRIMRFLTKPCAFDTLLRAINDVLEEAEEAPAEPPLFEEEVLGTGIIGDCPAMQDVKKSIAKYAKIDSNVLILGESGTGKELVADALHQLGPRSKGPIIKVNCPALPESLIESELFGSVKGAYTGASKDRMGRFRAAKNGSLFLDEIGDLPLPVQVKLLRAIETKQFEPVGDHRTVHCDARIITATNRNLLQMVDEGTFRRDLYYRLKVITVSLPPLREREGDALLLAQHFLKLFSLEYGKNIRMFSDSVRKSLQTYHWPGNIRELKHVVEHAVLFCSGDVIRKEHLTPELQRAETNDVMKYGGGTQGADRLDTGIPAAEVRDAEARNGYPQGAHSHGAEPDNGLYTAGSKSLTRENIQKILRQTDGNKAKAARLLGIGRSTLYRHMKSLGLDV